MSLIEVKLAKKLIDRKMLMFVAITVKTERLFSGTIGAKGSKVKNITSIALTLFVGIICISCAKQEQPTKQGVSVVNHKENKKYYKNYEEPRIMSCDEIDSSYRDICVLHQLKNRNILNLLKKKKITADQAEIMIANEYNWVANATSERFSLIK